MVMKISFAYPYGKSCGILKLRLDFEDNDSADDLSIEVNESFSKLNFDINYIKANKTVSFGLNTYKVSSQLEFELNIGLYQGGVCLNRISSHCENDINLDKFIRVDMRKLPLLVPLPISSSLFVGLVEQTYPSPYLTDSALSDFKDNGFIVLENFFDSTYMDAAARDLDIFCSNKYQGYEEGASSRLEHLHLHDGYIQKLFNDQDLKRPSIVTAYNFN